MLGSSLVVLLNFLNKGITFCLVSIKTQDTRIERQDEKLHSSSVRRFEFNSLNWSILENIEYRTHRSMADRSLADRPVVVHSVRWTVVNALFADEQCPQPSRAQCSGNALWIAMDWAFDWERTIKFDTKLRGGRHAGEHHGIMKRHQFGICFNRRLCWQLFFSTENARESSRGTFCHKNEMIQLRISQESAENQLGVSWESARNQLGES